MSTIFKPFTAHPFWRMVAYARRQLKLFKYPLMAAGVLLLLAGGCVQTIEESSSHEPAVTHIRDIVYGRKDGLALTMDMFRPKDANGIGIIWVASGGWYSSHEVISIKLSQTIINSLVNRGYTVFAVVHGSQPKYTIPEILQDMQRGVRYVRYRATDYHIDPHRIGIIGASSGGHLALMQAVDGDLGNPKANDPVERISSRVQAAACFFPPTDFLNYGTPGESALGRGLLKNFPAPFDFHNADSKQRRKIGWEISPINHVTSDDPPTLIIHGELDSLVPLQQSETMIAKLKKVGVPAQLIIKPGAGHGWPDLCEDTPKVADWFDEYLRRKWTAR